MITRHITHDFRLIAVYLFHKALSYSFAASSSYINKVSYALASNVLPGIEIPDNITFRVSYKQKRENRKTGF